MTYVLQLTDIEHQFADATQALSRTDINISQGEFVSIVGPSGCGKSTLLRIASGLLAPSAGAVHFKGSAQFVFQDSTLLPWRNVSGNVALNLELQHVAPDEIRQRTAAMIDLVGLTDSADKLPRQLSGGMKMRVSLARSLVCQPDLFLFDEPFASLDEFAREKLNSELRSLLLSSSTSSIFVTHSISEAIYLADRVLVMSSRPGSIIEEFVVPFGTHRDAALRYSPEFAQLAGSIASVLRATSRS